MSLESLFIGQAWFMRESFPAKAARCSGSDSADECPMDVLEMDPLGEPNDRLCAVKAKTLRKGWLV